MKLQKLPADISKLVNLRVLTLTGHTSLKKLPDAISGLQMLEHLQIAGSPLEGLPDGITSLTKLASLRIKYLNWADPMIGDGALSRIPNSWQVVKLNFFGSGFDLDVIGIMLLIGMALTRMLPPICR